MTYYEEAFPSYFANPFTRDEWLEVIGNQQQGGSSFSVEAESATIAVEINWTRALAFIRYAVGWSYLRTPDASAGSRKLIRENPKRHPQFPWLTVSNVSIQGIGPVGVAGVGTRVNGLYTDLLRVAKYDKIIATVTFADRPWSFQTDAGAYAPSQEMLRNTYLEPTPSIEVISAEGINNIAFANGPSAGAAVPAPFGTLMSKITYTLNWMWVPHEYISTTSYPVLLPTKILACVGRVNADTFFGFPPGTLLLQAPVFQPHRFPIATADRTVGFFGWNVRFPIQYFDPPRGGSAGVLTTRTDDDTGTITFATAAPTPAVASLVRVSWSGGERTGMVVTAVGGLGFTATVDGGTGDALPAAAAAVSLIDDTYRGHQCVPRRQDLLWYGAIRADGTSKIYQEATFANLFANANA